MSVAEDFYFGAIKPTLDNLKQLNPRFNTASARKIMFMTAAHESGRFQYRRQIGGPALSFYQIEPATLHDLYDNFLGSRTLFKNYLDGLMLEGEDRLLALEFNDIYATMAARFQYWRVPEALPDLSDDMGLANYAKQYWNTPLGAATPEKYLLDYKACVTDEMKMDWGELI